MHFFFILIKPQYSKEMEQMYQYVFNIVLETNSDLRCTYVESQKII